MPNVNIPETENIKLVRTNQEMRRRQPHKKNKCNGCTGEDHGEGGGLDADGSTTLGNI